MCLYLFNRLFLFPLFLKIAQPIAFFRIFSFMLKITEVHFWFSWTEIKK